MKTSVLIIVATSIFNTLFSQTLAEWTQQNKTQRKYLIQQTAALQTYLGYVKKGYDIAHKGISAVQTIKNGEWNLHEGFFASLTIVNPVIKKYAKVSDIFATQARIVKYVRSLITGCNHASHLNPEEIEYVARICDQLLSECLRNIDELAMVITSGELEMKDDERIKRIETIYTIMRDRAGFLLSFGNSIVLLSKQRLYEKLEVEVSQKLYGINR